MRRCDVLVVGAGLAGLWTARLLAEAGLRVTLVDDRARVDRRIRTTGIFVRRTLEDFALPAEAFGPEIRRVVLYSPAFRALQLTSEQAEFRVARMGPLLSCLLDAAVAAGVEWRPGTRCGGIEANQNSMLARFGRGAPLRTRFVIGADGAKSRVAEWLGLSRNRDWIVGVEEVYEGIHLEGPPVFHCLLSPELAPGYLAWLVHDGEEVHVGVGGYASRFDPGLALATFKARLPGKIDWGLGRMVDRRGGLIPVGGVLPEIVSKQGLLVGDASGAVSPLTAGGIDPCLRLSELAAKVAFEYLESGQPAALTPYDGARFRRRFRSRLLLRAVLARMTHPAMLEAACAGLRMPGARQYARRIFFGRGSFPDVDRFPHGAKVSRVGDAVLLPRSTA